MTRACSTLTADLTLQAAADLLEGTPADAGPIVLLTHTKPDGDALGCVLALTAVLDRLGKATRPLLVGPVSGALLTLPGAADLPVLTNGDPHGLPEPARIVIVDTAASSQLGSLVEYVHAHLDRTLVIDHHLSGDLAPAHQHIDPDAPACALLIAQLIRRLPREAASDQPPVPSALYAGLASDTGWFRFSNTTPAAFRLAADLIEQGVDHAALFCDLEQNERPGKPALIARALASLRYTPGSRAAIMSLRLEDFAQAGATPADTEGIVNLPLDVGPVQATALLTERDDDGDAITVRVSFRSKPPTPAHPDALDVAALAARFDGGGHARAAGGRTLLALPDAVDAVYQAFIDALC